MVTQAMQFVAVTSGGIAYDIEFPLHPETRSPEAVSELVTALLAAVSAQTGNGAVSDGDILQALAMTSAIRGRMIDGEARAIVGLSHELLDTAWDAVQSAPSYKAGRA